MSTLPLAQLRRESHSIFHRIHSIAEDAIFVSRVHDHYVDFPLLPNMRCGAWYTDPAIATERAYFKSTDGHTHNWCFNLRRPNLHILPLIAQYVGLVLVDSTRAGKRIPDALSKTVPIWCAVVNRAILKRAADNDRLQDWDIALYTPPGSVSPQEHSQIEDRLDGWATELAASSYSLPRLDRPLRPIWITPATTIFPTLTDAAFHPIICVSASKQVTEGIERRTSGFAYIQGSGDDHELWSMGLTPILYWKHRDKILSTDSANLADLIQSLVLAGSCASADAMDLDRPRALGAASIQRVSGRIAIGTLAALCRPDLLQAYPDTAFVCLTSQVQSPVKVDHDESKTKVKDQELSRILTIQTPQGKKGQYHFLSIVLPGSMPFVQHHLQHQRTICIVCDTGTDISVGVALATLALFFRPDGSFCAQGNARDEISKGMLKIRLQWIISSCPRANPSRTTLKRINDFLLSPFSNISTPGLSSHPGRTPGIDKTTDDHMNIYRP